MGRARDVLEFTRGWSIRRLADDFGMADETVAKRIREANVEPCGEYEGNPVYKVSQACRAILQVHVPGANSLKDPDTMVPLERRAYYQSQNEKIKFETSTGLLVPAAEVERSQADLVKTIAQFFDTLPDVLERDCGLNAEQVVSVQESCDRVRQAMYEKVVTRDDDVRESA